MSKIFGYIVTALLTIVFVLTAAGCGHGGPDHRHDKDRGHQEHREDHRDDHHDRDHHDHDYH